MKRKSKDEVKNKLVRSLLECDCYENDVLNEKAKRVRSLLVEDFLD